MAEAKTYKIPYSVWAGGTIVVESEATDPELILEDAYAEGIPHLCYQCSGGNKYGTPSSLEIGDEWEPVEEDGKIVILNEDGTPYVAPEA